MIRIKAYINYYNITYTLQLDSELKQSKFRFFRNYLMKNHTSMKEITGWCRLHDVKYTEKWNWRKDYNAIANLWNLYSYIRFRLEETWHSTGRPSQKEL